MVQVVFTNETNSTLDFPTEKRDETDSADYLITREKLYIDFWSVIS